MTNYSDNCSHSTNNRLSSSSVTASTFEDAAGDSASFYRSLLRHHQSTLFMDDTTSKDSAGKGDTCELEIASDDCSRGQKNNHSSKTPSRYVRGRSVSSRGSSAPSLYPRIVDDDEDDTNISTTTRAVSEKNEKESSLPAPISPFYLAALEDAALEEEEELLMLQQHERNHLGQRALASAGASATGREANFATNTPSSFYRSALEAVINSQQELEDKIGGRQSTTYSFSSSSISSGMNTPVTTSVASPTVLSRSTTNESNLSQVQRRLSDISFSSYSVLPIETESIALNPRSRSFVDDSCAFSVTRSSAMPHMTSAVLSHTLNEANTVSARSKAGLFTGKTFCDSPEMLCSKAISGESEDDEYDEDDEDLRMAIYLSRVESSAASSLHSERTLSASISTKGSRIELEEENKKDQRSNQNLASSNGAENNNEFLMSQFRAMEECQRNNRKKTSPSNQSHSVTDDSSLCQDHSGSASSSSSSSGGRGQRRRRSMLETRGATETRQAISNGNSQIVKCKGCQGRLQAPLHYSLVFCPKCQTVSPA